MGQAKQRGTFEERKQAAIERNAKRVETIAQAPAPKPAIRRQRSSKLAVAMLVAGAMQR